MTPTSHRLTASDGSSAPAVGARALIVLAVVATALALMASSALAAGSYTHTNSFGTAGTGASQFSAGSPGGIGIDQTSGVAYVADTANSRIEKFQADGTFVAAWGWGVDDGTAAAQVCTSGCEAGISGNGAGQFAAPAFVAVDNSGGPSQGDVYIADTTNNTISKFGPNGAFISVNDGSAATDGPFTSFAGIAVDGSGNLIAYDNGLFTIFKFAQDGAFVSDFAGDFGTAADGIAVDSGGNIYKVRGSGNVAKLGPDGTSVNDEVDGCFCATGVAVDPATDDLYINRGTDVAIYHADGSAGDVFATPDLTGSGTGLAVRGSNARAYVADAANSEVDVFDFVNPPVVATDPPDPVHHTSAVLKGHLAPNDDVTVTACHFDYGPDISYGSTIPCAEGNSFTAPADVSASLGGLTPGGTVHFRLVITTAASGVLTGDDRSFAPSDFSVTHNLVASFGPDGTSGTVFNAGTLRGLAVDSSRGSLFAASTGFGSPIRIYGFDSSAAPTFSPLSGFDPLAPGTSNVAEGLATDATSLPSGGNVYYMANGTQLIYGVDHSGAPLGGNFPIDPSTSPGAPNGSPSDLHGVAVDSAGHIWVANGATNRILEYDASGVFQTSLDVSTQVGPGGGPYTLAMDLSNDDLYVSTFTGGNPTDSVWRFTAASSYATAVKVTAVSADALAVDPTTKHLFLAPRQGGGVQEYDAGGNLLAFFAVPQTSGGANTYGVAVDPTTHRVYVSDNSDSKQIQVYDSTVSLVPTLTQQAPASITGTSATLRAKVDPENIAVTDCHFDYGIETDPGDQDHVIASDVNPIPPAFSYTDTVPCAPDPGSGSGDVAVHADISGLDPGRKYHFRVSVSNAHGTARGTDQTLTTLGPRIRDLAATQITTNGARLEGSYNPQGVSTTFHYEYGTTDSYGQSTPESAAVSDSSDHSAIRALSGLTSGTTYHFRLIATSSDGVSRSADHTFTTYGDVPHFNACSRDSLRTGLGARLPDCRVYEQVTDPNKNGGNPQGQTGAVQASPSGDAIAFISQAGLPGAVGSQDFGSYMARRSPTSWSTHGLLPPQGYGDLAGILGWSPDLEHVFSRAFREGTAPDTGNGLFDEATADHSFAPVVPHTHAVPHVNGFALVGSTADASKVFFESDGALTSGAADGNANIYVWDRATGDVTLASALSGGATPAGGAFGGAYDWYHGDTSRGGALDGVYTQPTNAISADGSHLYFTAAGTGKIYLRTDATGPGAATVQVSASQKTNGAGPGGSDPLGPRSAAFMAASKDGSRAFFTSPEELTNDANTGTADQGSDLYRYDASSGNLRDVTPDSADPMGAGVQGVLGTSDDGTVVYFAANGVLASGATPGDCDGGGTRPLATHGACSLYRWHEGAPTPITFVARLSTEGPSVPNPRNDSSNWVASSVVDGGSLSTRTARVSPDGGTLLFASSRSLTGYDNSSCVSDPSNPTHSQVPCREFYRYAAATGDLNCVSCNPTGTPSSSNPSLTNSEILSLAAGSGRSPILPRNLSADGNRVFFQTPDPLVSRDTNGIGGCAIGRGLQDPCQDVYEWEAMGTGSCNSASANGGCLYLLSAGQSAQSAFFADASADGGHAFIYENTPLVASDQDQLYDIYDVVVDGGLAAQHQAPVPPCSGDACHGDPTPPSVLPVAGSVTFAGPGNAPARPGVSVTAKPKVTSSKTVRGSSGVLSVKVPSRGRVRVSGPGLRAASVAAGKAGTFKVKVVLSAKARRAWQKAHVLRVRAKVVFAPSSGASATATVTLTFRTVTTKKKGR